VSGHRRVSNEHVLKGGVLDPGNGHGVRGGVATRAEAPIIRLIAPGGGGVNGGVIIFGDFCGKYLELLDAKSNDQFHCLIFNPFSVLYSLFLSHHPMYTLAGFDLTTHSSNRPGGMRRRYHYTPPPGPISWIDILPPIFSI
jgi:hypothetical protein